MFINYMFVDDIRRSPPSEVPDAGIVKPKDLETVEVAIRSLDGNLVRQIILGEKAPGEDDYNPFGGSGMLIGGGAENRLYVCRFSDGSDDTAFYLSKPENDFLGWQQVMSGQPTEVEGSMCVGFEDVLRAAREFALYGRRIQTIPWIRRSE